MKVLLHVETNMEIDGDDKERGACPKKKGGKSPGGGTGFDQSRRTFCIPSMKTRQEGGERKWRGKNGSVF